MSTSIDKNIPLPPPRTARGAGAKYPWAEMDVGDSFQFDVTIKPASAHRQASTRSRMDGRKYSVRAIDGVARCWRVA